MPGKARTSKVSQMSPEGEQRNGGEDQESLRARSERVRDRVGRFARDAHAHLVDALGRLPIGISALDCRQRRAFAERRGVCERGYRAAAAARGATAKPSISSSREPAGAASCIARTRPSSVGRSER